MADKYIVQRRTSSGLEMVAELPVLEDGKIDLSWLPVVGTMGSAIIERGSNANGEYVKFADGTMWCWVTKIASVDIIYQGESGLYRSDTIAITFPATFINIPSISVSMTYQSLGTIWGVLSTPDKSWCTVRAYREASLSIDALNIYLIVFGCWK